MNSIESPTQVQPEATGLQAQVESLRQVIISVLVLVVVVSGTLNLYFWRQFRTSRGMLKSMRQVAPQMSAELSWMQDTLGKFLEYGRTHPDFAPVLAKHGVKSPATTGAPPASASSPAASAAPAAKKK
jgi:hypothetical protein